MVWKTFLVIYFKAGNKKVSEIVKKVESIGFKSMLGPIDFVYVWKKKPTKQEVINLADKLVDSLNGTDVVFNIDTHEASS